MKKRNDIRLSVIMPTFNEADNVLPLLAETLHQVRQRLDCALFEIIVVDDDSPDRTWELVQNYPDKAVRVLRRLDNRGLCNSIWEGIESSRGDVIVWMDCDFSHPPRYIAQMVECVALGWDIAVNSRYVAGGQDLREGRGTPIQKALSWILNALLWTVLGQSFRDYTSGFVAAKKSVVEKVGLRGDYGEYFIDFISRAIKDGYRVLELPYTNERRKGGESKTGTSLVDYFKRGRKYLRTVWNLRSGRRKKQIDIRI